MHQITQRLSFNIYNVNIVLAKVLYQFKRHEKKNIEFSYWTKYLDRTSGDTKNWGQLRTRKIY